MFREVNERLQELAANFQEVAGTTVFACECADLACVEQIDMTHYEYEAVRSESNRFLVAPGHVLPDVEKVVEENDRYVMVAKIGEGATIAVLTDARG